MNSVEIKKELYKACISFVEGRISVAKKSMENAQASANEETKSSAGDKYETGRAMAQIERDKNAAQLSEALKLKNFLDQLSPETENTSIGAGSLVVTNSGNFYLAVSLGKYRINKEEYFVIAAGSPIGVAMLNKRAGEEFQFNGKNYKIEKIG